MSSSESVHNSVGGDVGIEPYGFVGNYSGFSKFISLHAFGKQPGDVSSLESDIGKGQIILNFENSALHLPSAKKGFKKLTGSLRTPGESSSTNFRAKNRCTEVISSLQKHADPEIVPISAIPLAIKESDLEISVASKEIVLPTLSSFGNASLSLHGDEDDGGGGGGGGVPVVEPRKHGKTSTVKVNDGTFYTLPFGGIGESGTRAYYGKFSFDAFSHKKVVMYRSFMGDAPSRYPPYTPGKLRLLKALLDSNVFGIIHALFCFC
ncbi:aldehyde dehydrogenase family 3 member H1-like protein isoform X1 [Tanacetum coccineum]